MESKTISENGIVPLVGFNTPYPSFKVGSGINAGKRKKRVRQKSEKTASPRSLWAVAYMKFNGPGFPSRSRAGIPDGLTRSQALAAWAKAREQAKRDMDNLEKLYPTDDDIVKEATLTTLEIMRGPECIDRRLRAARQLLDFYKAKPVAKAELTVSTAEAWLAQVASDAGMIEATVVDRETGDDAE